jgi:hypothetical protein
MMMPSAMGSPTAVNDEFMAPNSAPAAGSEESSFRLPKIRTARPGRVTAAGRAERYAGSIQMLR